MGQAATRKSLVAPFHQRVVLFSQGRKSAGPRYVENAKYSPRIRHMSSRNQLDQQTCRACSNQERACSNQEYDVLGVSETVRSNRRGEIGNRQGAESVNAGGGAKAHRLASKRLHLAVIFKNDPLSARDCPQVIDSREQSRLRQPDL